MSAILVLILAVPRQNAASLGQEFESPEPEGLSAEKRLYNMHLYPLLHERDKQMKELLVNI